MADTKVSALAAEATPLATDELYLVDDAVGTPASKKVTAANLGKALDAGAIPNTPAGAIAATDIQAAIDELDSEKSPLAGSASIVTTGALDTGSITSGFTSIDVGAGAITTTGLASLGNITLGTDGTASVLTLTEKASIALDPAGGADGDYSGITITGTAGENLVFGETVYFKAGDSKWWETDADADATAGAVLVGIVVVAGNAEATVTIMTYGQIRADAQFPALTIGAPVYLGVATGEIQVAAPSGNADVVKVVGHALTADEILFNPSPDWIVITA